MYNNLFIYGKHYQSMIKYGMSGKKDIPKKFNDFLTINQAAEFLGVSISTLRNWDRQGKFEATRHPINGYRLYQKNELLKMLRKTGIGDNE
jgi:excisionase family DNA binding protein